MVYDLDTLSLHELIDGYKKCDNGYCCIMCNETFNDGEVYQINGRFFQAEQAVRLHVITQHGDRLSKLINSDSRYIQLTDNQRELLLMMSRGMADKEIAAAMDVTPSTIRRQRFIFREKAKSAKMYLALWEMAQQPDAAATIPIHGGAKSVDERFDITKEEFDKIAENIFESIEPLRLKIFPVKQKKKIVALVKIAEHFEQDKKYAEKEVNAIIKAIFDDYVTIRRYLIEYGFMDRTKDCREYWLRTKA